MRLINLQKVLMLPHGQMFHQTIGYALSELVWVSTARTPNFHVRKEMDKFGDRIDKCRENEMSISAEEGDFIRRSLQGAHTIYPFFIPQLEGAIVEDVVSTQPVESPSHPMPAQIPSNPSEMPGGILERTVEEPQVPKEVEQEMAKEFDQAIQ